jgi:hypothetical protein
VCAVELEQRAGGARLVYLRVALPDGRRPVCVAIELPVQGLGLLVERGGVLAQLELGDLRLVERLGGADPSAAQRHGAHPRPIHRLSRFVRGATPSGGVRRYRFRCSLSVHVLSVNSLLRWRVGVVGGVGA